MFTSSALAPSPAEVVARRAGAVMELVTAVSELPSMRGQHGRDPNRSNYATLSRGKAALVRRIYPAVVGLVPTVGLPLEVGSVQRQGVSGWQARISQRLPIIFRYSFSVKARSVSVCTLPFEAIDSVAFASDRSSAASEMITIS